MEDVATLALGNASASLERRARSALKRSAAIWFAAAVVGQWIFIAYLLAHYVLPALAGGLAAWSDHDLATGYVEGDPWGNLAVAMHVFLAMLVLGSGQLQLVPSLRARRPAFHRWSGRVYMMGAVIIALAGLYMVWIRGNPRAGLLEHIGTSSGAVLIIAFAVKALYCALERDIRAHRRWALRLFMVVSGVWFIRLGYGLWFLLGGSSAIELKTFSVFISYAQYLVPLAVLELYLRTGENGGAYSRFAVAALILCFAFVMGIGIHQATVALWIPRVM